MAGRRAWWALLVLLVRSAAQVPDPENVTVSCRNTAVAVGWDYPEHQPRTLFRVSASLEGTDIIGVETTERRYDLTHLAWDRQKYFLEYLTVQVTALQGGNESNNKRSNSFSFNSLKVVDTRCSLEVPPVEINVAHETATVSFPNPIQHYQELRRTIAEDSELQLSLITSYTPNGSDFVHFPLSCSAKDRMCKVEVPLSKGPELCVKLKGNLLVSRGIWEVNFRETNQTCVPNSDGSQEATLAIVLTTVTICIFIMAATFICKAKAWTMKTPQLNVFPVVLQVKHNNQALRYVIVPKENISPVSIVQRSKSLSDTFEDDVSVSPTDRGDGWNHGDSTEAFYTQRDLSESSSQTDSDSSHCSVKTDCVSISSEGEPESRSDYDCPHVHLKDMGGGDFITAYNQK